MFLQIMLTSQGDGIPPSLDTAIFSDRLLKEVDTRIIRNILGDGTRRAKSN